MSTLRIDRTAPEFQTIETFAGFLYDDERDWFTLAEAAAVASNVRTTNRAVIENLAGYGLIFREPRKAPEVRGYTANPNTRWAGNPGAGGGGGDSLIGFAGREG